ncbi:hypothetical protein DSO57_1002725, partial [Entomophthora muscae]
MTHPLTLQPNCLQKAVAASDFTFIQIFGVMHITLTGLIDYMVPSSRPWAILRKSLSYILNLAPSCGGPFLLGLWAVHLQVLRNLPQDEYLTRQETGKPWSETLKDR